MHLLAEQLFVLSLDPHKKKPYARSAASLSYGLAAAILTDLLLDSLIEVRHKKIVPLSKKAADPLLEETLMLMNNTKPKTPEYWVTALPSKLDNIQHTIARKLENSTILTVNKKYILGLFPSFTYECKQENLIPIVRERFVTILEKTNQQEPLNKTEERHLMLLSLLQSSKLVDIVFTDRNEVKKIEKQVKHLNKNLPLSKSVKMATEFIDTSITMAIATAVVTSTTSSSSDA
ncbi:GPP34 family phosphoprotein [Bacillus sp. C1-1]|nr:GPP34 family phosphoprotein [Bacillus sp. C1-1]